VVRSMCIEMIADIPLRDKAARFCDQLRWIAKEGHELLLSIFATPIPGMVQLLGLRKITSTNTTVSEIADLGTRLWEQIEFGYEIIGLLPNSEPSS